MTHKHIQIKANTDKLCETKRNNATSASDSSPSRSLSFSPPLDSCSDIYVGPASCPVITLLFNILFLWYFPLLFLNFQFSLSIVDLLISVCALKLSALFSLSLQDTPLTADWLQVCFGTQSNTAFKRVFQKLLSTRDGTRSRGTRSREIRFVTWRYPPKTFCSVYIRAAPLIVKKLRSWFKHPRSLFPEWQRFSYVCCNCFTSRVSVECEKHVL